MTPPIARVMTILGFVLLGPVSSALADDKEVVEYREHIMKTLHEQSEALGQIVTTNIPDDNTVAHLDQLALAAGLALKAFEPKVPGGEAKAAVWTDWPDFAKRMNEFAQKTAATARVAHEQGKEAGLAGLTDALTCKGCHDTYRQEKK